MSPANYLSSQPRLTRRQLLKGSLAAGTLLGLQTLITACVPAQSNGVPATGSTAGQGGGTLRFPHLGAFQGRESLDPAVRTSFRDVNNIIYERLIRQDLKGRPAAWLATEWKANETATEWTFTLRKDVKFHDGTPLTAQDVVYSFQRIGDKALKSGQAAFISTIDLTALKAVDDHTVSFTLTQPSADFPVIAPAIVSIIAKDSGATIARSGNGTGAFKLQKLAPAGTTVLIANEAYWGEKPKLAQLELVPIADGAARINALLAGQIDFANFISRTQAAQIKQNPAYAFEVTTAGLSQSMALVMRTDTAPFDDVRVRKAMKLVIDRKVMLQTVVQGDGVIGFDDLINPDDFMALTEEPAFDVAQAKALLAEAGHADGLKVTLHTTGGLDMYLPVAVTYKEMAAAAGIEVEIKEYPVDSYVSEAYMQVPFFITDGANYSTPFTLDVFYRAGSPFNECFWNNAEATKLLDQAQSELDEAKRKDLYLQVQRLAQQEGGYIVPFFSGVGRAYNKRVKGLPNSPLIDWTKVYLTAA